MLAGILYAGGWHTEVIGFLQRGLLYTGLFTPGTETDTKPQSIALESLLLYDETGTLLRGSELKGELLLVNIWATWCGPCVAEMPGLSKLYQEMGSKGVRTTEVRTKGVSTQGVRFLMVTVDKDFKKAIAFRDRKGYNFPIYRLGQLPNELQGRTIPATYVIGPQGQLYFKHEGMAQYDTPGFKEKLLQWQQAPALSDSMPALSGSL